MRPNIGSFIAQLVEHPTGIGGGHGFESHVSPEVFFRLLYFSCLNWKFTVIIIKTFIIHINESFHIHYVMPYFVVIDPAKYTTFLQSRPEVMEDQAIELVIKLCREYRLENDNIFSNLSISFEFSCGLWPGLMHKCIKKK